MNGVDWEARYVQNDTPWEKGEASPGLVDFLETQPGSASKTVCVPGCGMGHDVRAWARAGFSAVGFDVAPSAIRLAKERTRLNETRAEFERADFLADRPSRRFDWIFEHTLFCAIDPSRRRDYLDAVLRWIKPNGYYLAVNYLIPDQDGPPFGTTRDEIRCLFAPRFKLLREWIPRSYPNRIGLERMFLWQPKRASVLGDLKKG